MTDQLFVFSILLFSVFSVPIIAGKTKIPGIVFYILFGVILERFVFMSESLSDSFHLFSEIGKLYLMFIAGLEINTFLFKKNASKSVIFGLLSFVIPQVLGTAVIISLFGYSAQTAILAASLFASQTLLSLGIINKFGIGNSEPISVAVGATVVSDIAVLGLLAIIADISRGVNITLVYGLMMFGGWTLFIASILFIVPKIAKKIFKAVSEDGYSQFLFVFATACLVSWAAHELRLESLIGAFFCGLALSKLIPNNSILMTKINFVGNTLFIPFFLISAGMLIRSKNFEEASDALILGIVLTVLTIITKTAAGLIFGKIFKYSKEAVLMTAGMTFQQAATTIAIAVVGLEIGIIDETIFNAAMILILLTCTIGEIASVYFAEKYAQNLPKKTIAAISSKIKTLVLVPNVANCSGLFDFACMFRTSAKKYIISPLAIASDNRESVAEAETVLGFCMNYASELEENCQPEMRIANNTIDGILRAAIETKAGMIVCPFENYSQSLIDECPPCLIFAKIAKNISSTKQIRAVFAPTSEDNSDISLFIAELKHFSQQVSAEIVFYLSEKQKEKIMLKINKFLRKTVNYKIVVENNWNTLKQDLPNEINEDDAIVVFMDARQKLFHSPSVDKYPFHLSEKFKQNNIFAVYSPLSLVAQENEESLFDETAVQNPLEPANIEAIETRDNYFESIIDSITQKNGVPQKEIYDILLASLELHPVELVSDVVLIHAHTEAIENPQIFVWSQKEKQEIIPSKISPKVLIVVLNPLNGDPQIHLKTLSRIAGLFMNPRCTKIMESCRNSKDLIQELHNF